jgi:small subunit ribosomal protein S17
MAAERESSQRERQGVVVSDGMDKTIVVEVSTSRPHPLYKKVMRRTSRVMAHDETNEAHVGDKVIVRECRPLSRHKSWRLIQVLERAR